MVYHQLLVCCEGNFGVQLKVTTWWPTLQNGHAVALLCAPDYHCRIAARLNCVILRSYSCCLGIYPVPPRPVCIHELLMSILLVHFEI